MVITAARHQAGGCTEGEGDCEMNTGCWTLWGGGQALVGDVGRWVLPISFGLLQEELKHLSGLLTVCLLFMRILLGMSSCHKLRNGKGKHMPTLGGLSFSLQGREEYMTA